MRRALSAGALLAAAGAGYVGLVRGAIAPDLKIGRRTRPLGPLVRRIAAPREVVFDVISEPYLRATSRALSGELKVLERGEDMVLAEHYTPVLPGLRATTTETVRFSRPDTVSFRLVRGPVPHVAETFELADVAGDGTELRYTGELATDLWRAGALWGDQVARIWVRKVESSLAKIADEAERRARTGRGRSARNAGAREPEAGVHGAPGAKAPARRKRAGA